MRRAPLCWLPPVLACLVLLPAAHEAGRTMAAAAAPGQEALGPMPPSAPVKLIFIHHSTGQAWLEDGNGGLAVALRHSNYFVSDTNYGWGPDSIGDYTDIPHWYRWFTGPSRDTYTAALYAESGQHSSYSRLATDPGGPNTVVMFKSCFPNSNLGGNPGDPPSASANDTSSLTVANAKRIYLDLLPYFAVHPEKLFVVIAAPPLRSADTTASNAANARAFDNWLVSDWLSGYAGRNVAVFDFYTVLTSNGGSASVNDLGATAGNHHRLRNGVVEHITTQATNYLAYPTGDSHPSQPGNLKATGEFVDLLNLFYLRWRAGSGTPPTFTDNPLVAHGTPVKAVHIAELRQRVADLRTRYGLSAASWTDSTLGAGATPVRGIHVAELRSAIGEVYTIAGRAAPVYSQPSLTQGLTVVRAADIAEIRSAILTIW
jgi:hypothetical protein